MHLETDLSLIPKPGKRLLGDDIIGFIETIRLSLFIFKLELLEFVGNDLLGSGLGLITLLLDFLQQRLIA